MEYIVADHKFVLNGVSPDILSQYEPFLVEESDLEPLFVADFVTVLSVKECEDTIIGDFSDEEITIKVYKGVNENYSIYSYHLNHDTPYMVIESDATFAHNKVKIVGATSPLFALNNAVMMIYTFASSQEDTLLFHSSVIAYKGKAYMFLGKSGTGKSTHSSLWLRSIEGTHLLNDDNPVVRVYPDKSVTVFGSPWSGKTPCYRNESFPLGGIVRIWQKPENNIEQLKPIKGLAMVLPTVSSLPSSASVQEAIHKAIIKVVECSSVYSLGCLPNVEAAELCNSVVVK